MITPQPGDFGLTQIHGRVGKLIRAGQWLNGDGFFDYEHAFVYVGEGQVIEAEPGGARLASLTEYNVSAVLWSTGAIGTTEAQRASIVAAARGYIGTPYSFLDYASLAAKRLHLWAPGLHSYVRSSGHMICSQLVAKCYFDAGCALFPGWTGDVTPGDLCNLVRSKAHA
jgi:cell wall-associated NlpC family hydrolase